MLTFTRLALARHHMLFLTWCNRCVNFVQLMFGQTGRREHAKVCIHLGRPANPMATCSVRRCQTRLRLQPICIPIYSHNNPLIPFLLYLMFCWGYRNTWMSPCTGIAHWRKWPRGSHTWKFGDNRSNDRWLSKVSVNLKFSACRRQQWHSTRSHSIRPWTF